MPDDSSNPGTEAFVPDFGDTGEHSVPFTPNFDDTGPVPAKHPAEPPAQADDEPETPDVEADAQNNPVII